ncbi:MAG: RIP metalloprotease RseP [bacterium]
MNILQILIGLVFLGVLVVVHEAGHFFAAKLLGVRVKTFSIGFGKKLLHKKWGDTEYCISAVPFGGYVRMEGEDPSENNPDSPTSFSAHSPWHRITIAAAGPMLNFFFAFFVLWLVFMIGVHVNDELIISQIAQYSPADMAGIEVNDRIISINGEKLYQWEDVAYKVATHKNKPLIFRILRDNADFEVTVTPNDSGMEGTGYIGIDYANPILPVVAYVVDTMPAARAGIQTDDTIIAIHGKQVRLFNQISPELQKTRGEPVLITIKRGDSLIDISVIPVQDEESGRLFLGIQGKQPVFSDLPVIKYPPLKALLKARQKFAKDMLMMYEFVEYLINKQISIKAVGGPVSIITIIGVYSATALDKLIFLLAMISINLGVINLVPFLIISDGGLISFFILEWIRGKPLKQKTQMLIQKAAVSFIIVMFLLVTFNDIHRLFKWFN